MDENKAAQVKELIRKIFAIAKELNELTQRPFTPDGHMVGSMGEVYAELFYGVKLHPPSHRTHDGHWNGREVQIKTTQRTSVDLKSTTELLLVFKINPDGSIDEVYNGDGTKPWDSLAHRKPTKAGEISISLKKLSELNKQVPENDKIKRLA